MVLGKLDSYMKRMKLELYLTPYTKIISDDSSSIKSKHYAVFMIFYSVIPALLLPPSFHLLTLKADSFMPFYFFMGVNSFLSLTLHGQLFILRFNSEHHHFLPEFSLFLVIPIDFHIFLHTPFIIIF